MVLNSVRGGVRAREVKQKAHSLAAGTRVSRTSDSDPPGSEIHAFPPACRAGEGVRRDFTWDSSEGMKEEGLRKRSEKIGFFLFRYDEANRSGGDCY